MTTAPLGLAYLDRDLRFVHVNQALADIDGTPPESHLGSSLQEVIPLVSTPLELLAQRVLQSGIPIVNMEISGQSPSTPDQFRHWIVSLFPVYEEGRISGVGLIVLEATARKKEELDLTHQHRYLHAMVNHSPEAVAVVASDGRVLATGPAPGTILGYTIEDFAGPLSLQRIHPEDFDRVYRYLIELRNSSGKEMTLQYRTKHVGGSWCWVEAYGINAVEDPKVEALLFYYRDITERKAVEEHLIHQAFHDPLTHLPNRIHFINSLEDALQREADPPAFIAVMFIDLDGFKVINDSLGHSVGDDLLLEVSHRFQKSLRANDSLARMGGDEFTILLHQVHRMEEAVEVAKRILAELDHPFLLSQREIFISASIGIALALPGSARSGDLLRKADIALYEAKKKGKDCFEIFDLSMNERAWRRLEQESDLRRALEKEELLIHYQPVIDLQTGRVVELEALVRWNHPERGLLPPLEFIPLAEETGQILEIDFWVLRTAAETVVRLRSLYPMHSNLSLNVNFSALQFRQDHLVDRIARTLAEAGLPPQCVKIEITESVMKEDRESILSKLKELKKLGVRLSIDDFGAGAVSMNHLRRYPLDILKIDRSFTRELQQGKDHTPVETEIVSKIFSFGKALGMGITGEGIENVDQLYQLKKMGCKLGQGFLFAKPQPIEDIHRLFELSASGKTIPLGVDHRSIPATDNGS